MLELQPTENEIVVPMTVKRGLSAQEWLDSMGRKLNVDPNAISSLPLNAGGPEKAEFVWIKVGRNIGDEQVDKILAEHGLVRDLGMQLQYNAEHPWFAQTHPNGYSWKNNKGEWCVLSFNDSKSGEARVQVRSDYGTGWNSDTWIGGRRAE